MARRLVTTATALGLFLLIAAATPGCSVGYLAQQGWFQAELLVGRQPIDEAIAAGHFSEEELERLHLVPRIKQYGQGIGLAASDNYDTINPTWKRTIWNVSACDPVAFEARKWWFPIVGSVPYLGYFREEDARRRETKLLAKGYDVHVRTAGAYSTLGWFRDPLLPGMLKWSEYQLADTLLHELAHATLWVPGSVQFNESFANFVGEEAAMRYLTDTYGADSQELRDARERVSDRDAFREMLLGVYQELDAVYTDPALSRDDKLARKAEIIGSMEARTDALDLFREEAYLKSVREGEWNNARLLQFKTYNRSRSWFAELLSREDGDLGRFIERIDEVTRKQPDPYASLAAEVGAVYEKPGKN